MLLLNMNTTCFFAALPLWSSNGTTIQLLISTDISWFIYHKNHFNHVAAIGFIVLAERSIVVGMCCYVPAMSICSCKIKNTTLWWRLWASSSLLPKVVQMSVCTADSVDNKQNHNKPSEFEIVKANPIFHQGSRRTAPHDLFAGCKRLCVFYGETKSS